MPLFDVDFEKTRKELLGVLSDAAELTDDQIYEIIDGIVMEKGREQRLPLAVKENLREELFSSVRKLDVIQPLIDDCDVTEVMVNGYRDILVP